MAAICVGYNLIVSHCDQYTGLASLLGLSRENFSIGSTLCCVIHSEMQKEEYIKVKGPWMQVQSFKNRNF